MNSGLVSLVMACGLDGQIGLKNDLPWHLPEDLKHFKDLTFGQSIIMGRRTFESIGRPLPGRQNIVVSSKLGYLPGVTLASSLDEALLKVSSGNIAYVIGGVSLWVEAVSRADSAIISLVEYDGEADVSMPPAFFEHLREHFRLNNLKPKEGFTLTEWLKAIPS